MTTVIMRTTARVVVPLILVVAVSLFLQGHNLPGGGFIGGVLATTAFALVYISYGLDFPRVLGHDLEPVADVLDDPIVVLYRRAFLLGLVIAIGGGLVPLLFDLPFLSQTYVILHDVPIYGEVEIASAVVFDLGVFLVVVGGFLTVLSVVGAE
ncbi:MnhB domain-containing protein [Halalkalicoccus subterraneus]|uniref:MnhB domain-containing protein n=1 Tax=Halalkalicoccus subterraneus TaxID=2675002 RepID=UPI000EFDAEE1